MPTMITPQRSLFNEPDAPTDRLLLAFYPDQSAGLRIARRREIFKRTSMLTGPEVDLERLHMTLIHIGDYIGLPQGIVAAAGAAAARMVFPPFNIVLDRAMSFSGQPGVLPFVLLAEASEPLMTFQRELCTELALAGVRHKSGKQFTPHVTLLRDRISVPEQEIEPICWTAREFVLVHSLLGQTQHIPLGRWSLS
jgi:2'-5' RNA ligase